MQNIRCKHVTMRKVFGYFANPMFSFLTSQCYYVAPFGGPGVSLLEMQVSCFWLKQNAKIYCEQAIHVAYTTYTQQLQQVKYAFFIFIRYEVQSCEVIWCIKHKSISAAFFDESAAQFFLPHIQESGDRQNKPYTTRWKYSTEQSRPTCSCMQ